MAAKHARTIRTYEFGPARSDTGPDTDPVRLFDLRCITEVRKAAVLSRESAILNQAPLTRRQLQEIGTSALDWLAYLGDDPAGKNTGKEEPGDR
jgi:hypothetical protein